MAQRNGRIEVDGLKPLNLAVRKSVDRDLPKRLGQANKAIGELLVSRLHPRPDPVATGQGAGATVRPSASKREVLLRVGGAHRASGDHTRKQPWGKRRTVRPGTPTPDRPNILGTAERHRDEISDAYLTAVEQALRPAFADTEF